MRYEPTENLAFQASWSESFQPPVFSDTFHIVEPREDSVYVQDPYDVPGGPPCIIYGCQVRRAQIYSVGDDLRPETADAYSLGFEWTPDALSGLIWTVHWSKIEFTDKIEFSYNLLFSAPEVAFKLPEIIERDADGNAIKAFARYINLSEKVSEILTTELEYSFTSALGAFRPRLSYTRVLGEHFTIIPGSTAVQRVGTTPGSNEYGLVGSLAWTAGKYAADIFVRYTPSYENDRSGSCRAVVGRCEGLCRPRPTMTVDPHTTVDLTVSYRFENGIRLAVLRTSTAPAATWRTGSRNSSSTCSRTAPRRRTEEEIALLARLIGGQTGRLHYTGGWPATGTLGTFGTAAGHTACNASRQQASMTARGMVYPKEMCSSIHSCGSRLSNVDVGSPSPLTR